MNAVKRCLALFAATLVVGACSGDPTADDAGTGLTIRTTPSVVWMREDQTLEIDVEAIDALGGTAPGSWTATTSGPLTAALDTDYQETTTGGLAQIRRFILTPTAAGEGSVTFTGTGGNVTIPVRISPDPVAFDATISNLNPVLAEQITVTAPVGVRFTAGTAVSFVSGGTDATTNGLAAPSITAFNGDSTQITVLPAPGAVGRMRFTGVANVSTPTLTSTVTMAGTDSVTVPALTSVAAVIDDNTPGNNQRITITMPANFKLRPTSAGERAADTADFFVVSRSADSLSFVVYPTPATGTPAVLTALQFSPLPTLSLPLPTSVDVDFPLPDMGTDNANVSTVTIGQMTAPTVVNDVAVYFDTTSYLGPDNVGDGGIARQQDYLLTVPAAGTYNIRMKFTGANTDLDMFLTSSAPVSGANSGDIGFSFLGNGAEETVNFTATAGQTIIVSSNWFAGPAVRYIRFFIRRTA